MDAAHQLPSPAVGIIDRLAGQRHPGKLRLPRPAQAKLSGQVVCLLHQGFHCPGPVCLIDVLGVDKTALILFKVPLSAHSGVIDHVQRLGQKVIGEKHILRGFQRHTVALLLLQQDILRRPLLLGQLGHHIIEGVDF